MSRPPIENYPRQHAIRVLTRVLSGHEPLDQALEAVCAEDLLAPGARAWLQDVCSGTLRWKGRLDLAIDSVALKKKPSGWLRKALLIASYQLVAQDRAQPGAVVSETVSLVKRQEGEAPARFANACLRKLSEHSSEFRTLAYDPFALPSDTARWSSLPLWLWNRLIDDRGLEWSKIYALASLERPVTWIRLKEDSRLPGAEAGPIEGSLKLPSGSGVISEISGFDEGTFFVQDISSQTLVDAVSREVRVRCGPGVLRALDLCAAPGGKSAGLAWNGFQVTSTDRPENGEVRFDLLKKTLARVAPEVQIVAHSQVPSLEAQDLVWVDAPCSGSGILRRHPDVRWLRQEKELEPLALAQRKLLNEAWSKVRPGGFLVYSVCSVLKGEGSDRVSEFLQTVRGEAATLLQQWFLEPQHSPQGDGFWGALIQRSVSANR